MTAPLPIAVVIPAAGCVCDQSNRVAPQLNSDDQLVVVQNGRPPGHDCAARTGGIPRSTWRTYQEALGPAGARNAGITALDDPASIYAFTDADDQVAPTWLAELTAPLAAGTADVTGGPLVIVGRRNQATVQPGRDYWHEQALFGTNLALTASAWNVLAGFDPDFRYGEDTDLAWRAAALGLRVHVVPTAVVQVQPRRLLPETVQRFRWGRTSVGLLRHHNLGRDHLPSLRQLLTHKRSTGYCGRPSTAALAQWVGQGVGRRRSRPPAPTTRMPARDSRGPSLPSS